MDKIEKGKNKTNSTKNSKSITKKNDDDNKK